jgi:phosphoglycerol transferase
MTLPGAPSIRRRFDVVAHLVLALACVLLFCWIHARWTTAAWRIPVFYTGDALFNLGLAQSLADGAPPWDIRDARLNAPFSGALNAYPLSEKLPHYLYGLLAAWMPPGVACNMAMLLAQLTAALGFLAAARLRGARAGPAAACALVFAFSHYLIFHTRGFVGLAYVGHVPFFFVLFDRLLNDVPPGRRVWQGGLALAALSACMSPYYGFFLLVLLGTAGAGAALRGEWRRVALPALLAATFLAVFALNQTNVILDRLREGENPAAVYRTFAHLNLWGLRLGDLVWPTAHVWEGWTRFAARCYFGPGTPITESRGAFLGLGGLLALLALGFTAVRALARRTGPRVPVEAGAAALTLAFALAGGLAHLLGSFGFLFLRCTNRYSIILLCLALLFLCRVPLARPGRMAVLGAALLLLLRGWELLPHAASAEESRSEIAGQVASDQAFAAALEAGLPAAACVFQLPVTYYPEQGYVQDMGDYEHLRPFIWSRQLRFSYGECKDRPREGWQRRSAARPAAELVRDLEAYGFSALCINRRGYADRAAALEQQLRAQGLAPVADAAAGDLVAYRLHPAATPRRPRAEPAWAVAPGFGFLLPPHAPPTPDLLWSSGDARLVIQRGEPDQPHVRFACGLTAGTEREVRLRSGGQLLWAGQVGPATTTRVDVVLNLTRPSTSLEIETKPGPVRGARTGSFLAAFALHNPRVRALATGLWPGAGFHGTEQDARGRPFAWAERAEGAELILVPPAGAGGPSGARFGLMDGRRHQVRIQAGSRTIRTVALTPREIAWVELSAVDLAGVDRITLHTDQPPRRLAPADARQAAFMLVDPAVQPGREPNINDT